MSRPTFDERDQEILNQRADQWNKVEGPRVGDFVIFPDGHQERFSHDWGQTIQTTDGRFGSSFYLGRGYADFSGGLNPSISKDKLEETDNFQPGGFWFFHHDYVTGHNGVHFEIPCRTFRFNA